MPPVNDCHFNEHGYPVILAGGEFRALAAKPTERKYLLGQAEFGLELPESRWQEIDLADWQVPILDQGKTNSCVGQMWGTLYRYAWRLSGQPDIAPSPWWIYGWINEGRDAGAQVGQGLRAIRQFGVALSGDLKDGDLPPGKVYFPHDLARLATVISKAHRYRVYADYRLRAVKDIPVALSLGFVVGTGILVDRQFGNLDAEGVCPLPDRTDPSAGGHAVALVGLKKSRRWGWCYRVANSWSRRWGNDGFGWIHNGHFTESGWPFDTWALQCASDSPDTQDMPAVLPFAA